MKKIILLFSLTLALYACGGTTAALNLQYQEANIAQSKQTLKIALIDPQFTAKNPMANLMANPLMSMARGSDLPIEMQVNQLYYVDYVPQIKLALTSDLEKILSEKGFVILEKYASYDEMPYSAKENVDLILEASFDFVPMIHNKPHPVVKAMNSGDIQLMGKLQINLIEPLSKEKILLKTIKISSSKNNYKNSNATAVKNAMTELLNFIYPEILTKTSNSLDVQEIVVAAKDVAKLKAR